MTILLQHDEGTPKVEKGFANRLVFEFWLYHDLGDDISYNLLGPYDISISVLHPQTGQPSFIGWGKVANSERLAEVIMSGLRSARDRKWEIHVGAQPDVIGQIDNVRRLAPDVPVRFQFTWGLAVEQQGANGSQRQRYRERVMQPSGPSGSGTPVIDVSSLNWFKITEAYGFRQRRLIELVFPTVDTEQWQGAADDLAQAERDFDSRDDRQAMGYCEQAFEDILGSSIVMNFSREQARQDIARLLGSWGISDQRKQGMVADLVDSCAVFARRGKHRVDAAGHPEFDPNSGDAELALLVTKAVLGYLSRQRSP